VKNNIDQLQILSRHHLCDNSINHR